MLAAECGLACVGWQSLRDGSAAQRACQCKLSCVFPLGLTHHILMLSKY